MRGEREQSAGIAGDCALAVLSPQADACYTRRSMWPMTGPVKDLLMNTMLLAGIAAVCGGLAILFWTRLAQATDALKEATERADNAEGEARKNADRGEALKRKLDALGEERATAKHAADKAKAQVKDLRSELDKATATATKATKDAVDADKRARRAERKVEELEAMLALKGPAKTPTPAPVEEAPAPPPPPKDSAEAVRLAELQAERDARKLEMEQLKTEREKAKQERLAEEERAEIKALREERKTYLEEVFKRERALRASQRKERDNHRAYIVTKGQLDLALDDLYRIRHGAERPTLRQATEERDAPEGAAAAQPAPSVEGTDQADGEAKKGQKRRRKRNPKGDSAAATEGKAGAGSAPAKADDDAEAPSAPAKADDDAEAPSTPAKADDDAEAPSAPDNTDKTDGNSDGAGGDDDATPATADAPAEGADQAGKSGEQAGS